MKTYSIYWNRANKEIEVLEDLQEPNEFNIANYDYHHSVAIDGSINVATCLTEEQKDSFIAKMNACAEQLCEDTVFDIYDEWSDTHSFAPQAKMAVSWALEEYTYDKKKIKSPADNVKHIVSMIQATEQLLRASVLELVDAEWASEDTKSKSLTLLSLFNTVKANMAHNIQRGHIDFGYDQNMYGGKAGIKI